MENSLSTKLRLSSSSPFFGRSFIKDPIKTRVPMIKTRDRSTAQVPPRANLKMFAKQKRKPEREDLSDELYQIACTKLDHAPARREVRSAFVEFHQNLDHFLFKVWEITPFPPLLFF
uniref:Uncharacterized protein n=1 Tax=Opuntia streptacantha TaxID=393608 RepID=A0A7C9ETC8_OPUST